MSDHPSAAKRYRQNQKRRAHNAAMKSAVRTAVKQARAAEGSPKDVAEAIKDAQVALARAGSKNVFHKRNVSRRISRLAILANKLARGEKVDMGQVAAATKAPAKKAPAKAPKAAKAAKAPAAKK